MAKFGAITHFFYTAAGIAVVDVQVVQSLEQFSDLYPVPFRVLSRQHEYLFWRSDSGPACWFIRSRVTLLRGGPA